MINKVTLNRSRLVTAIILSFGVTQAIAQTETAIPATVTVANTITLDKITNLNFGTVAAKASTAGAADVATLILPADATATAITSPGTASFINIVTPGSPATFEISGVAPDTSLTLDLPGSAITLEAPTPATNFSVDGWSAFITSGPNAGSAYTDGSPNLKSDVDGKVNFSVGATLSTDLRVDAKNVGTYTDDIYTGIFDITVNY
ncbi:DUF4402 domain-containing protein [Psychromonas hadalis]|uniref:DUF4402 domain-containing protein n=1 Tax=Psychromonas hadalis TaxID=211669 RepID=UPI0003B6EC1E|nr:DUF4402 domain-containing protein [Psychromonas hadalis]